MKKTFKLQEKNKNKDRVVESIKHEIRKYIKREQNKPLPEDKDFWFFDCKFAKGNETPIEIPFSQVIRSVDDAANSDSETFYLEIISKAEKRKEKEIVEETETNDEENLI